jgi:hypothetical protein
MTEAEAMRPVVAAARALGWRCSHDLRSEGQEPGEPDWRFTWCGYGPCPGPCPDFEAEVKVTGHRTREQRQLANDLVLLGRPVVEWRLPEDYDQVERHLGLRVGTLTGVDRPATARIQAALERDSRQRAAHEARLRP